LIVSTRRDFEYKLRRKLAQKIDYVRYIQYETNLDSLRKIRKKKNGKNNNNNNNDDELIMIIIK